MSARKFCSIFSKQLISSSGFQLPTLESSTRKWEKKKLFQAMFVRGGCTNNNNADLFDNDLIQKYLCFIQGKKSQDENASETDDRQTILGLLEKKEKMENELRNLINMNCEGDKEMENLLKEEKETFQINIDRIKNEILENLLPVSSPSNQNDSTEIKIIPAIGGEEAKLFSKTLYEMYLNYATYKNWDCQFAEMKDTQVGCIILSGDSVFNHLRHEAGVHRVQRVPATEKLGRTHTSTCSVVVLEKKNLDEININEKDLIYETIRSSGPGGQNVNKLETCVRLKHKPTGIQVECQDSRFQFENKKLALKKLKNILYEISIQEVNSKRKATIKEQVGTNDYSDKIRTYNYIQNRVSDHRINFTMHNLTGFLLGGKELDYVISRVSDFERRKLLLDYVKKILNSDEYKDFEKSSLSNSVAMK